MYKRIARAALIFSATALPLFAQAATSVVGGISSNGKGFLSITFGSGNFCVNNLCSVAQNILYIINNILVPVLFAVAFLTFLYGIAKTYIFSVGDQEAVKEGHKILLWGLIGFVVMISLWGLVNVVANTFGLRGSGAPILPRSY